MTGRRIFISSAKNRQERAVYLTPTLMATLRYLMSMRPITNDDHLRQNGSRRLTDEPVRTGLRPWGKKCGNQVTPHRLRHTFAARLLHQGVSMEVVRKLLGHSSLKMSQHYAHLLDRTVKDQFESVTTELKGVYVRKASASRNTDRQGWGKCTPWLEQRSLAHRRGRRAGGNWRR